MPVGSYLTQQNVNPRHLILAGALIAFPFLYLSSVMESFAGFAVFFVVGLSINQGLAYMVPVHHGWLWWPKYPGLVSGLILSGFGCGSLIFDTLLARLINPKDIPVDKYGFYPDSVNERFIKSWQITISIWLCIVLVGMALIFKGAVKLKVEPISKPTTPTLNTQADVSFNDSQSFS